MCRDEGFQGKEPQTHTCVQKYERLQNVFVSSRVFDTESTVPGRNRRRFGVLKQALAPQPKEGRGQVAQRPILRWCLALYISSTSAGVME